MAKDNKEFNFKDFILHNEEEETENVETAIKEKKEYKKPEVEYILKWADHCDFIVERKTKKTSQFLVMMLSQGQLYIKDNQGKVENLTLDNYVKFMEKVGEEGIKVNTNWCNTIYKGKRDNEYFIPMIKREEFQTLAKNNLIRVEDNYPNKFYRGYGRDRDEYADFVIRNMNLIKKTFELLIEKNGIDRETLKEKMWNYTFCWQGQGAFYNSVMSNKLSNIVFGDVYTYRMANRNFALETIIDKFGESGAWQLIENIVLQNSIDVSSSRYGNNYVENLQELLEITEFKFDKFMEYFVFESDRQGYMMAEFVNEWKDTLNMQKRIYGEVKNKYPENLSSEHQKLGYKCKILEYVEEEMRKEKKNGLAKERGEELQKNCMSIEDYIVDAPKSLQDILDEAEMQHNCLASYIDKYVDGTSDIYFMRKKKKEETSYITMEVKENRLVQAYAKYNRRPNEEAMDIIRKWCKKTGIALAI